MILVLSHVPPLVQPRIAWVLPVLGMPAGGLGAQHKHKVHFGLPCWKRLVSPGQCRAASPLCSALRADVSPRFKSP